MKKLKNKVFWVIFLLLTTFTFVIIVTTSTKAYIEKLNSVEDVLTRFPRSFGPSERFDDNNRPSQNSRRIFMDFTVYTVILDDDGDYYALINNTSREDVDEESIKEIAQNIIDNHKEDVYIGSLYADRYAYSFTSENTLIIMDNANINNSLVSQLLFNVGLFMLAEVIISVISYFLTKWIITPVKNSFEKQKAFVADASHELKTPLSVMIASADAYFNDKDEKWVHNMKNESERMIKLVTQLLDLAKTEEDLDIVMSENNLSDIVEGSILTFESLFYEKKIKFKYEIEPDIKLSCNEDLIVELLSILIDNAIKHCSDKGKVFVNLSKKNKQIVLEIKNTGLPIKKEDEEKIFERFYKVDSSRNRNSNNYGLGLAIAKNIVTKHSGEIKAHSSDGYTSFIVTWNQK